jgi:hypothetical protein
MAKSPAPSPAKLIKAQLLVAKAAAREKKAKKNSQQKPGQTRRVHPQLRQAKSKGVSRSRTFIYFFNFNVDLNVLQVVRKGHAALFRLIAEYNRGLRYLQRRLYHYDLSKFCHCCIWQIFSDSASCETGLKLV